MPAVDTALDAVGDQVHRMADDMARSDTAAQHLHLSFTQMVGAIGQFRLVEAVESAVKRTAVFQKFSSAVHADSLSRVNLLRREISLDNERLNLERAVAGLSDRELTLRQHTLEMTVADLATLQKQKILVTELERFGKTRLALMGLAAVSASQMFVRERELNQDLIEANSNYGTRAFLLKESLMTTAQLGISFDKVTAAAKALVHWGMDSEASFSENVRLISQMEQGLGVSVNESARLASIVERQLQGSFEGVAHVVAQLVDDTALAGDEATRLATSIATAMGRLRPGLSAQSLPEVLKLVGRYESALKEVGGAPGAFQQLVESLTRPEGIIGAGALGISPEFISTTKGVQDVMERFSQYGQALVGQSEGWARQMRLQQLGEIFHVSADQANQLLMAVKRARDEQTSQISVQERWRQQLSATNSGVMRLANSLGALLNGSMYPIVFAIGAITNKMADFLEYLLRTPAVVYTVTGVLFVGFVSLASSMYRVARAMVSVVTTSQLAVAAVARFNASMAVTGGASAASGVGQYLRYTGRGTVGGAFGGALGGLFSLDWIRGVWTGIKVIVAAVSLGTLLLTGILAGLAIIGFYANKQWSETKSLREQSRQLEITNVEREKALEQNRQNRIFSEARNLGSSDEILKQYTRLASDIRQTATSDADYQSKLADAAKQAIEAIDQGVTTRVAFKPLKERTPEEAKKEEELLGLTSKIYGVNKDAQAEFKKRTKLQEQMKQETDEESAKNRIFFMRGKYNPLRKASDAFEEYFLE